MQTKLTCNDLFTTSSLIGPERHSHTSCDVCYHVGMCLALGM